jgi:L-lactate dehydrogenase complex protein LldG
MKREAFLQATREALGKAGTSTPPKASPSSEDAAHLRVRAQEALALMDDARAQLVERLCQTATARGWHVAQVSDTEQAIDHVVKVARDVGVSLVVRSAQEVFDGLPVDGALAQQGMTTTIMGGEQAGGREAMRQAALDAQLGITGVDYAIAETGSVVLLPSPRMSRLTSLLPPVHLAIVRPREVLGTLDDLFLLRRLDFYERGVMAPYLNFITGPSRTADIEQQIVIGVHGPGEVHMLIWHDSQAAG